MWLRVIKTAFPRGTTYDVQFSTFRDVNLLKKMHITFPGAQKSFVLQQWCGHAKLRNYYATEQSYPYGPFNDPQNGIIAVLTR